MIDTLKRDIPLRGWNKKVSASYLKHIALSFLLFALSVPLIKAQNLTYSSYDGRPVITTYNGYIHLTDGFHVAQGQTVHIFISPGNPPVGNVTTNLSAANNYIASWTATAPDADPNHLTTRPLRDAKLTVQYFDGLGRPLQTVAKQGSLETATGTSKDLVVPVVYDALGREATKYLPYASGTGASDGSYKTTATGDQVSFYNNTPILTGQGESGNYAQSQIVYEASPLNRVLKTMAPGKSWVGASVGVGQGYWTNTATDNVQYWTVSFVSPGSGFGTYTQPTAYQPGTLYKNVTTDENNHQVIEFKDKEGHVVLKKVQLDNSVADNGAGQGYTGWLCTYYLYDDIGNLRCVIQPKGVEWLSQPQNNWNLTDATILAEQCFRYEYDGRNRMIIKQVPGAGPVYMVYDARDRLVATQDANMRGNNSQWLVTQYDNLNRPVRTGLYNDGNTLTFLLSAAYNNSTSYPDANAYPGSAITVLTETHYDNYDNLPAALSSNYLNTWDNQFNATDNSNFPYPQMPAKNSTITTTGLVTWTKTAVLKPDGTVGTSLSSVNVYDDKARVVQVQKQNYSAGVDVATTQYSWAGQPLITVQKTENPNVTGDEVLTIVSKMTYDDLGRVVKTEKKQSSSTVNGGAMKDYATTAQMQYDALGQLSNKQLGSQRSDVNTYNGQPLETQVYDYNIRGWLLGVNRAYARSGNSTAFNPSLAANGGSGESFTEATQTVTYSSGNYFGFDLGYDNKANNLVNGLSYTKAQLNGNIAGMVWKSAYDGMIRKYDFDYDNINRLLKADFNQYNGSSFDRSAGIDYTARMGDGVTPTSAYDANGNIIAMKQGAGVNSDGSTKWIDNLSYAYFGNSNKLQQVTDVANDPNSTLGDFKYTSKSGNTDYAYDGNGNLVSDNNKGITAIQYNYLNLPRQISVSNKGTISYIYDAGGSKLQKVTTEGTKTTTTTYIGGTVYQQSSLNNAQVSDTLQFFSTEEGRGRVANNSFAYDYFLKDHLSNTRMVLTDDYNTSSPILEANSYYPFGLTQSGISLQQTGAIHNRYMFGGKELNDQEFSDGSGLGLYDFSARNFDPQLGRWWSGDPKANKSVWVSPYNYCLNNPIKFFDPDGNFPYPIHIRAFIPAEKLSFLGNTYKGDGRGYSTTLSNRELGGTGGVTSRMQQVITVDPSKNSMTTSGPWADPTTRDNTVKTASATGQTIYNFGQSDDGSNRMSMSTSMASSNPLPPKILGIPTGVAADIDVKSSISISENIEKGTLTVNAAMNGDRYPAGEMFIGDTKGQQVMLIASPFEGSPANLIGDGNKSMGAVGITIKINEKGEFTGVVSGTGKDAKTYSIEEWNKKINSTPLEKKNNSQ